jgi:hypothetical protein
VKCTVCGIEGPSKYSHLGAQQWDWFTGYLQETVHFCPQHKGSAEYERLRIESLHEPATSEITCCHLHRIAFTKNHCDICRMIDAVAEEAARSEVVKK